MRVRSNINEKLIYHGLPIKRYPDRGYALLQYRKGAPGFRGYSRYRRAYRVSDRVHNR